MNWQRSIAHTRPYVRGGGVAAFECVCVWGWGSTPVPRQATVDGQPLSRKDARKKRKLEHLGVTPLTQVRCCECDNRTPI